MNQDIKLSSEKREAFNRLFDAARLLDAASDKMDSALAALLGVNPTDGRCLDIIQRFGRITAGTLARQTGLTTGAVTTALDRLERAGYLRRVADPTDRRKVLIEMTELSSAIIDTVFRHFGELGRMSMGAMEIDEIDRIARVLRTSTQLTDVLSARLLSHVDDRAGAPEDRLRAAERFSAGIAREREALVAELTSAWTAPLPESAADAPASSGPEGAASHGKG